MISLYKRTFIAIISTTLLHASIFYSLSDIEPKQQEIVKFVEIAMIEDVKVKKEEQPKPLESPKVHDSEKPKTDDKPKQEPKKEVKLQTKAESTPILKEQNSPIEETIVVASNESSTNKDELLRLESSNSVREVATSYKKQQCLTSKIDPSELEIYLSTIRSKIEANLKYPVLAKRLKIEGEVLLAFEILQNGGIKESSLYIKNSSGHKSLDESAIETVATVAPFDSPPQNNMSIVVPIVFKLN